MDSQHRRDCFVYKIQQLTQVDSSMSLECNQSSCLCRCSYSEQLPPAQTGQTDGPLWVLRGESPHTCDDLGTPGTSANTARDGDGMLFCLLGLCLIGTMRIRITYHHSFCHQFSFSYYFYFFFFCFCYSVFSFHSFFHCSFSSQLS